MEILLLMTPRMAEASTVLPALDLLSHSVRTAPRDVRALVSGPSPDVVLIDARSQLGEARATCRLLRATGLGIPLLAVVTEAGLIALNADWGVDDVILGGAGHGQGRRARTSPPINSSPASPRWGRAPSRRPGCSRRSRWPSAAARSRP